MTGVLSSIFYENNNKEQKKKDKKKLLRSGSGIRNRLAKAEGIPNGEGSSVPEINQSSQSATSSKCPIAKIQHKPLNSFPQS